LFRAFLRRIGLVGDPDETVDPLSTEFVGELGFELVNSADAEQQREEVHRDGRVSDLDTVAVGDFVAEPLGVGLDRIAVNLETVLVLENPFHACERILRGMKQAEVNNWFGVVAVLVEPLRNIAIVGMSALRALISLNLDSNLVEAILGDEWAKSRSVR